MNNYVPVAPTIWRQLILLELDGNAYKPGMYKSGPHTLGMYIAGPYKSGLKNSGRI